MDARAKRLIDGWIESLGPERREQLYLLLDELCGGLDVSRHNRFGFLRLRAEFETSGELFGCSLEELRDALGATFGAKPPRRNRAASALEKLKANVRTKGHPDFR